MRTPERVAVADLYLARGRVRAELAMQGYTRLSDLVNNTPGEFLSASLRMVSAAGDLHVVKHELVVRLRDVRLIRPIDEGRGSPLIGAHRERVPAKVVMDLDDGGQVTGEIHLVDRIPWLDFVTGLGSRFISVSKASIRFVSIAGSLECDYLLVNAARISALYEVL